MLVQRTLCLILVSLLMISVTPVWAQSEDTLTLKVATSLRFDSNLFRVPADTNFDALLGKSSAAERINVDSLSLNFSNTMSLQKIELSANLTNYRYQNFSYLSYVARNYSAAWHWAVTPYLRGDLGSQRQQTLNDFTNYQGLNAQNLRTNSSSRLDGAYDLDGSWSVAAGISQSSQTNQQVLTAEGDYQETITDIGLRYAPGSGNTLSYTLRNTNGTFLNRVASPTDLYDVGYKQIDSELKLHLAVSGKSAVDLYSNQISRTHLNYSERDYGGRNAGLNFNWTFSGKSALAASWARELASYQTSTSNYTQTDRISLGQVWQLSPKAVVRAHYEVAQSDYLGAPFGLVATTRSNTTSGASLSFDWQAQQRITISASLENANRKSNLAGLDYESKMATVSAQFSY